MTKKSPVAVLILPFVTFGIYALIWIIMSRNEMVSKGAKIPGNWQLFIPFWGIWYVWNWCKGVEKVTNKDLSAGITFLLMILLGPVGHMIIQSKFNNVGLRS